jgi:hypothetical protein
LREGSDGFTILRMERVEGCQARPTEALEKGVSVGKAVKVLGWYDNERRLRQWLCEEMNARTPLVDLRASAKEARRH